MKQIIIYQSKGNNTVTKVDTRIPADKSSEEIAKLIDVFNSNIENKSSCKIVCVDDLIYEAIKFLLGEDSYATTYTIRSVIHRLEELKSDVGDLDYEIRGTCDIIDDYVNDLSKKYNL